MTDLNGTASAPESAMIQDAPDPSTITHYVWSDQMGLGVLFAICGERMPRTNAAPRRLAGADNRVPGTTTMCDTCELIALEMDFAR